MWREYATNTQETHMPRIHRERMWREYTGNACGKKKKRYPKVTETCIITHCIRDNFFFAHRKQSYTSYEIYGSNREYCFRVPSYTTIGSWSTREDRAYKNILFPALFSYLLDWLLAAIDMSVLAWNGYASLPLRSVFASVADCLHTPYSNIGAFFLWAFRRARRAAGWEFWIYPGYFSRACNRQFTAISSSSARTGAWKLHKESSVQKTASRNIRSYLYIC